GILTAWSYGELRERAPRIANESMNTAIDKIEVSPGDLSPVVNASSDGSAERAWWVETGYSAPRIANETVTAHPVGVRPGDLSRLVNAKCEGIARAWWVESSDSALHIANETMTGHPVGVISGDLSPLVNACWERIARAWYVDAGNVLSMS